MTSQYVDLPAEGGASAGVSSLNAITGAVTLVAGSGISITPVGQDITIAATGSGITSINADTTAAQLILAASTGTDFTVGTSGGTTTIAIPSASATARGLVTTGAQTLAGAKTFSTAPILSSLTASLPVVTDGSKNLASLSYASFTANLSVMVGDSGAGGAKGLVPANVSGDATKFLRGDATWATPAPASGNLTSGTTGVTVTSGTGAVLGSGTSISVQTASGSQPGLLSAADWTTFNGKQASGSYITALTGDVTAAGPGSSAATVASLASFTLSTLVAGDLLYANGSGTLARLAKGTALQNLRMNAGATAPEWAAASGISGSWTSTTGNVVTTNGASTAQDSGTALTALAPKDSPTFTTTMGLSPAVTAAAATTIQPTKTTGSTTARTLTIGGGNGTSAAGADLIVYGGSSDVVNNGRVRIRNYPGATATQDFVFGVQSTTENQLMAPASSATAAPQYSVQDGTADPGNTNKYRGMHVDASDIRFYTANSSTARITMTATETTLAGNLVLGTAGNHLQVKTGSNCAMGTATLVGGTVTVSNTMTVASTTTQLILLTVQVAGGTQGVLSVGTKTAGTSFVINSSSGTDTSTVGYMIVNAAP